MESQRPKWIIRRTHLSRQPAKGAWFTALLSLAGLMLFYVLYDQDVFGLGSLMIASPERVWGAHEYWRLFTTELIHADLGHFFSNAFYFSGLAALLYGYFGRWAFPVLTLVGGAAANALALLTYDPQTQLLGASGAVYFMAAFWLALYFGIERRLSVSRRLIDSLGFSLALLAPTAFETQVSYRVHALGFVLGLFTGAVFFFIGRERYRYSEEWALNPLADPEALAFGEGDVRIEKEHHASAERDQPAPGICGPRPASHELAGLDACSEKEAL